MKSNFKKLINGNLAGFAFSILAYSLSGYLFGVEKFAAFGVAMSVTAPLSMLCSLKIDAKIMSEANDKEGWGWLNFATRVVPLIAILSTFATVLALKKVGFPLEVTLINGLVVGVYVTFCALCLIQKSVLIRLNLFNVIKWSSYISGVTTCIAIATASTVDTGWSGILSGFACGQLISFIFCQKKIINLNVCPAPEINYIERFKSLRSYVLTFNLASIIDSFAVGFPVIFLAKTGANEALSIYYLCQKIIYGPMSLVVSGASTILTRLVQENGGSKRSFPIKKNVIFRFAIFISVGYVGLLLFKSLFEGEISSKYALIVDITLILLPSFVLKSIGSGLSAALVATGNIRQIAVWQSVNAGLSFATYYIFSSSITGFQFLILVSIFESLSYIFYSLLSIRAVKKCFCIG